MILTFLFALAHADPVALRAPGPGPRLSVSGASLSLGAWHASAPWGAAVEGDLAGGPAGAWFGAHTDTRAPSGFGVDLQASAGLLLTGDLELALGLTPAAAVGWRGKRVDATLGLAAPLALRFTARPALTAPLRVEPWLGVHLGPVTLGAGGAAGVVLTTGELWAVDLAWMVSIAWVTRGG